MPLSLVYAASMSLTGSPRKALPHLCNVWVGAWGNQVSKLTSPRPSPFQCPNGALWWFAPRGHTTYHGRFSYWVPRRAMSHGG